MISNLSAEQEKLLAKYASEYRNALHAVKGPHDRARFERAIKHFLPDRNKDAKICWYVSPNHMISNLAENLDISFWDSRTIRLPSAIRRKVDAAFRGEVDSILSTKYVANEIVVDRFDGGVVEHEARRSVILRKFLSEIFTDEDRPSGLGDKKTITATYDILRSCAGFIYDGRAVHVAEKPTLVKMDERNRLHCADGPAVEFSPRGNSTYVNSKPERIYVWHGVHLQDSSIITHPETLNVYRIGLEPNLEVKRVMMERYGMEKYLQESDADLVDGDERWGYLYGIKIKNNSADLTGVGWWSEATTYSYFLVVTNRTAEPDGTFKKYVLAIHPQCRPLPDPAKPSATYGRPQAMTARNAVASTFGMTGAHYERLLAAES